MKMNNIALLNIKY